MVAGVGDAGLGVAVGAGSVVGAGVVAPDTGAAASSWRSVSAVSEPLWAPPELEITTPPPRSVVDCDGEVAASFDESGWSSASDLAPGDESVSGDDGVGSTVGAVAVAAAGAPDSLSAAPVAGVVPDAEVVDPSAGSAQATPGTVTAEPIPSATAKAPTRPMYRAYPMTEPFAFVSCAL